MKKQIFAAGSLLVAGMIAGCGGGNSPATSSTSAISGSVADGYLVNATVFLDRNNNYQPDPGEPSTVTDQNGAYTLKVAPEDIGKFPIVALAIKDQTTDMDNPGQKVAHTYLLSLPSQSVSGTVSGFISPMSTLLREKMEGNHSMSLTVAMNELRGQMNLPAGMNMMADYVSLGSASSNDPNKSNYGLMHTAARNMAALMAGEEAQVVGGSGAADSVDVNRYRAMMSSLNAQLPQMVAAMPGGMQPNSTMMNLIAANIGTEVSAAPPTATGMPFRNMSSSYPDMTNVRFWNMTGHLIPGSGMTGGGGVMNR